MRLGLLLPGVLAILLLGSSAAGAVDPVQVRSLSRGAQQVVDALDIDAWSRVLVTTQSGAWLFLPPHPGGFGVHYPCFVSFGGPSCFHELDRPTRLGGTGRSVGYYEGIFPAPIVVTAAAWSESTATRLTLPGLPGATFLFGSQATDENAAGVIVGYTPQGSFQPLRPVFWSSPTTAPQLMAYLGIDSVFPRAISDTGAVVGDAGSPVPRAVVWATPDAASFSYLGELAGGTLSRAFDVGASGLVVGSSTASGSGPPEQAVVWEPSGGSFTVEALPAAFAGGSCQDARVTNALDEIAGNCRKADGHGRGVIWQRIAGVWTAVFELPPLNGHTDSSVAGLNAAGLAVGKSWAGSMVRGVLWDLSQPPDPPPPPPTQIPVPALGPSGLVLLAGLLGILGFTRKSR